MVYSLSREETAGSRSPVTTTISIMEGEDESQDDFPCTLLSMITSNLEEERDEPASVSYDGSKKMKNCFTHSFVLGNGSKSKSCNDEDEHCGTRLRERELRTIYAITDDHARGGRGKRR